MSKPDGLGKISGRPLSIPGYETAPTARSLGLNRLNANDPIEESAKIRNHGK